MKLVEMSDYEPVSGVEQSDSEYAALNKSKSDNDVDQNFEPNMIESNEESSASPSPPLYLTPKDPFHYVVYKKFIAFIKTLIVFAACIYILFLFMLLSHDLRKEIHSLFSISSQPQHTTSDECEFNKDNILSKLNLYLLLHILNWFCYTLSIRNWKIF